MSEQDEIILSQKQKKIDNILNKTVLDVAVFSLCGWTTGLAVSIFFRQKAPIRHLLAGIGGSYGFVLNKFSLKQYA